MYRFVVALLLGYMLYPSVMLAQSSKDEASKPEFVMILNSYSYEQEWSTTLAKEIRNNLEAKRTGLQVNITYAGIAARTSYLADRFAMQGAFAYGRLSNKIYVPKVLVLIGDESWMLYRSMDLRGIWEKVPVVLCGVHAEVLKDYQNFFPDKQLSDTAFISLESSTSTIKTAAVIESDYTLQTLQLAFALVPSLQKIYFLSDGSYADIYAKMKLEQSCNLSGISLYELRTERSNDASMIQTLEELPAGSVLVTNGVPVPTCVRVPVLTLRDKTYQSHIPVGGYFSPYSAIADETVKAVIRFIEMGGADSLSYSVAPKAAYYLNQTALMHAGLHSAVENLPNVIGRNVPQPFIVRHIRIISIILLIAIVLAFVTFRIIYSRRYRHNLKALFQRYKSLYDEYQVVYENMPIGLMLFDTDGNLLKRNAETDIFCKRFTRSTSNEFRLFDPGFIDNEMREALFNKELVSRLLYQEEHCYRIQCCLIVDEETEANNILVIVIDNTNIENERKAKEKICNMLNFAMNKAVIGIAEYNLVNGHGFATDAWYDTLNIQRGTNDFSHIHQCLIPEDRKKVESYLENVRYGVSRHFLESLQIQTETGESHFIRYMIQPLEFVPQRGHIIVAEMILNMDEQMARERELETAMHEAQEADRFKNAFVANMRDEIRVPLKEVILCAQELVFTDDLERRAELNTRIESGNHQLLKLLDEIISISKVELDK
ncbi:hypothetical protein [Bacteroides sp.]|uniref:hypothetical protein n=1 Tax=Bacteroides sp. TaxID=29523 RepID=UPI002625285E|nr:hypothetical protein [Bacteroides sp.]